MSKSLFAAGTVCWRRVTNERGVEQIMVLLIHRTKQRDISFPKGKLDPGESMPQAAVRETLEETGLKVGLGVNLGTIQYPLSKKDPKQVKTVQYWAAEVTDAAVQASTFRPNSEVEALEWLPADEVSARLTYPADRDLYDIFLRLVARNAFDTFSVVLLRHAKAEPRSDAYPVDHQRPLAPAGEEQAEKLVAILQPFAPKRLISSTATRCLQTVAPLAAHLKKRVREKDGLSQDAWEAGDLTELRSVIGKVVRKTRNALICTHRPVLPDAVRELALATGSLPGSYLQEAAELPPGAFSVFHFSKQNPGAGILSVETYPVKL